MSEIKSIRELSIIEKRKNKVKQTWNLENYDDGNNRKLDAWV